MSNDILCLIHPKNLPGSVLDYPQGRTEQHLQKGHNLPLIQVKNILDGVGAKQELCEMMLGQQSGEKAWYKR